MIPSTRFYTRSQTAASAASANLCVIHTTPAPTSGGHAASSRGAPPPSLTSPAVSPLHPHLSFHVSLLTSTAPGLPAHICRASSDVGRPHGTARGAAGDARPAGELRSRWRTNLSTHSPPNPLFCTRRETRALSWRGSSSSGKGPAGRQAGAHAGTHAPGPPCTPRTPEGTEGGTAREPR